MVENRNGNGKWILASVAAVSVFISGLVIGWQGSTIEANDRYVTKSEYNRDKDDLREDLQEIQRKLDVILQGQRK